MPNKASRSLEKADAWAEQAAQAMQLANSIVTAAGNALQDANAALQINFTLPLKTYAQVKREFGKYLGGDVLYRKIIEYAEKLIKDGGCFVAGTLVHTQEGLRPIEQIKVGDYVLSKPESGVGEASYKRVAKTYEYEDREVWFLAFVPMENGEEMEKYEEYLVVTSGHPIWVKELRDGCGKTIKNISAWIRADRLLEDYMEAGEYPVFELQDGRLASPTFIGPILRVANPNHGLVFYREEWECDSTGALVDFYEGHPQVYADEKNGFVSIEMDLEPDYDYDDRDFNAIICRTSGYHPLLRKVYNFEVEDNHTYFVGAAGVLVHNTNAITCANSEMPQRLIGCAEERSASFA